MVLADVHLSDIIWSLLWLFFLFIWIMILVQVTPLSELFWSVNTMESPAMAEPG